MINVNDRGELPTRPRTEIQLHELVVVVQTVGCHHKLAQTHQKMTKTHDLHRQLYSPIRNLAILADFVCISTLNSHHSRDGGSVRGSGTMQMRELCIQCSPGSLDSEFVNRGRWRKLGVSRTGIFMNHVVFRPSEYTITIIRRWISKPNNCLKVSKVAGQNGDTPERRRIDYKNGDKPNRRQ